MWTEMGGGADDATDALRHLAATKAREVRMRKLRGLEAEAKQGGFMSSDDSAE